MLLDRLEGVSLSLRQILQESAVAALAVATLIEVTT